MSKIRLQKFIAEAGVASRRKAEGLIVAGDVTVNGQQITELGAKVDPENDHVKVNGKLLHTTAKQLLMMNKPTGLICSKSDPKGRPTVYSILSKKYQKFNSIGRLDFNTSGLLLFTNDGDFANQMMHPRYQLKRTYRTKVKGHISDAVLAKIRTGVSLEDGRVQGSAKIIKNFSSNTLVELVLQEGRNRIVRRLFQKLGHPVVALERVRFGEISLGKIALGKIHVFSERDFAKLKKKMLSD